MNNPKDIAELTPCNGTIFQAPKLEGLGTHGYIIYLHHQTRLCFFSSPRFVLVSGGRCFFCHCCRTCVCCDRLKLTYVLVSKLPLFRRVVTPNGGLVREVSPKSPKHSGLGIIVICPEYDQIHPQTPKHRNSVSVQLGPQKPHLKRSKLRRYSPGCLAMVSFGGRIYTS